MLCDTQDLTRLISQVSEKLRSLEERFAELIEGEERLIDRELLEIETEAIQVLPGVVAESDPVFCKALKSCS